MTKAKLSAQEKRNYALKLFMETDLTQNEICEIVGWAPKTFTANKQLYKWESKKKAEQLGNAQLAAKLRVKIIELLDEDDPSWKVITDLTKRITELSENKLSISNYISCFKAFDKWLIGNGHVELAKQYNALESEFINEKLNEGK